MVIVEGAATDLTSTSSYLPTLAVSPAMPWRLIKRTRSPAAIAPDERSPATTMLVPEGAEETAYATPSGATPFVSVDAPRLSVLMFFEVVTVAVPSVPLPYLLHVPLVHVPPAHELAQPPQWFKSVLPSISQPMLPFVSQSRKPGSQEKPQTVLEHVAFAFVMAGQAMPQVPQFEGSKRGSTHAPPQGTSGVAHVAEHIPPEHTLPASHEVPHVPQLVLSTFVFAQ